jgi:hypothetical protein
MLEGTDGFAVTVYVNAYDEKANALYDNVLGYNFTATASESEPAQVFTQ